MIHSLNKTKEFIEDLKKAHSHSTEGEWKSCAVAGGEGYANYGVTSYDTEPYSAQTGRGARAIPNVVHAYTDWEGYGNGSKLADTLFIAEAHNKLPVVLSALETIINMANNNGSITKEEIEEILVWGDISK
jgi:hypothetical protein